ncbi:17844_t:CDS:2, partial [Cetraspora pellucida]
MAELEPLLIEYDENDLTLVKKNISLNQKPHCIIIYNKTTLAANDDKKTRWRPEDLCRCIHVSEFLCEPLRHVHLTVEQHLAYSEIPNRYITETLKVGVNHDGYWNVQLLAEQLNLSHSAFVKDALVASRINIKYDGKQPRMHP